MASYEQAAAHYRFVADADAQRAEQERQRLAQLAAQQAEEQQRMANLQSRRDQEMAGYQGQRDYSLATYDAYARAQSADLQARRDYSLANYEAFGREQAGNIQSRQMLEQEGIGARQDVRRTDLQSQLNQAILTQTEEMRMQRMRNAIADVQNNPDLSPEERSNLITQLQTGLNPLENRQREASRLQTMMQTQALEQNTRQQSTLFEQDQAYRNNAMLGRLPQQTLTLPNGETVHVFMNARGEPQVLDTSWAQQNRDVSQAQGWMNVASGAQNIMQSQDRHPIVMQGLRLGNMTSQQQLDHMRNMDPLRRQQLQFQVDNAPEEFRTTQEYRAAQTALLQYEATERPQEFAARMENHRVNLQVAQQNLAANPTNTQLRQDFERARIAHETANNVATSIRNRATEMLMYNGMTTDSATQQVDDFMRDQIENNGMPSSLNTPQERQRMVQQLLDANRSADFTPPSGSRVPGAGQGGRRPMTEAQRVNNTRVIDARLGTDLRVWNQGRPARPGATPQSMPSWLSRYIDGLEPLVRDTVRNSVQLTGSVPEAIVVAARQDEVERQLNSGSSGTNAPARVTAQQLFGRGAGQGAGQGQNDDLLGDPRLHEPFNMYARDTSNLPREQASAIRAFGVFQDAINADTGLSATQRQQMQADARRMMELLSRHGSEERMSRDAPGDFAEFRTLFENLTVRYPAAATPRPSGQPTAPAAPTPPRPEDSSWTPTMPGRPGR